MPVQVAVAVDVVTHLAADVLQRRGGAVEEVVAGAVDARLQVDADAVVVRAVDVVGAGVTGRIGFAHGVVARTLIRERVVAVVVGGGGRNQHAVVGGRVAVRVAPQLDGDAVDAGVGAGTEVAVAVEVVTHLAADVGQVRAGAVEEVLLDRRRRCSG